MRNSVGSTFSFESERNDKNIHVKVLLSSIQVIEINDLNSELCDMVLVMSSGAELEYTVKRKTAYVLRSSWYKSIEQQDTDKYPDRTNFSELH